MSRFDDVTLGEASGERACSSCGAALGNDAYCPSCGASVTDPRVGRVVGGRYRIGRLIAQGGMGAVYRATHLVLGEPCVVKFLRDPAAQPELVARFRREAQLLARIGHPNAVTVLDYGEEAGEPYLALELVRGVPLSTLIDHGVPLSLARIGTIFGQLLEVLEAAHRLGIVHRDVKPDNVMLLDAGDGVERIKLIDFGLAIVAQSPHGPRLTLPGLLPGTPDYMSPEQCRGEELGPATDLYAVGIMLYETLTGAPPFRSSSAATTFARHMFATPAPIPPERVSSPALVKLIDRLLSKDAPTRGTAAEAREALTEIASGLDADTRATAERIVLASADRAARSIGTSASSPSEGARSEARVLVCCRTRERFDELAMALGVHGLIAEPWIGNESPAERIERGDLAAVLVEHGEENEWEHDLARALPVVAFDVPDTQQLVALIRAGVRDVAMTKTSDAEIGHRVRRTIDVARRKG